MKTNCDEEQTACDKNQYCRRSDDKPCFYFELCRRKDCNGECPACNFIWCGKCENEAAWPENQKCPEK